MNVFEKIGKLAGVDGLFHLLASMLIVLALGWLVPLWVAALVSLGAGVLKEVVWDALMKKGQAQWKDLICDAVGVAMGALLLLPKVFIV